MGGDSLGDGPYGIALIYRADCNLNQAHGAQFAAWAARVAAYERFGVPTYWIVNPDPPEPELTVFELRDGRYALAAKAADGTGSGQTAATAASAAAKSKRAGS
jgi:Putative restriction endonuclease